MSEGLSVYTNLLSLSIRGLAHHHHIYIFFSHLSHKRSGPFTTRELKREIGFKREISEISIQVDNAAHVYILFDK